MASCGYSEFVGGICGSSSDNPANVQCVTIENYNRNIKAHLKKLQSVGFFSGHRSKAFADTCR